VLQRLRACGCVGVGVGGCGGGGGGGGGEARQCVHVGSVSEGKTHTRPQPRHTTAQPNQCTGSPAARTGWGGGGIRHARHARARRHHTPHAHNTRARRHTPAHQQHTTGASPPQARTRTRQQHYATHTPHTLHTHTTHNARARRHTHAHQQHGRINLGKHALRELQQPLAVECQARQRLLQRRATACDGV
jgi:hypothetical protein